MFSQINYLVMILVLFAHFFKASVWKWHSLFVCSIYGIEGTTLDEETSIIIFGIKDKQLRSENS